MTKIDYAKRLLALARRYEQSKPRRIAAVYNDAPQHKKHLVATWFGVSDYLPRMYHTRLRMEGW